MKKIVTRLIIWLSAVFFVIYCYVQVRTVFDSAITTQTASVFNTDIKTVAECYLFRDEFVVNSLNDGVFFYRVNEGDKLSSNEKIADVYSSEKDLQIHNKVREIDKRIIVLENSSIKKSYLRTSVSKLDSQIKDKIQLFHAASLHGDFSSAVQNRNDFLTLLNKRYLVVRSEVGYDELIQSLNDEREAIISELSNPLETVVADRSGYFYSQVDGYEDLFNFSAIEELTVDGFFELINNSVPQNSSNSIGKLVTDFEWCSLCIVNKDESVKYESGNYYDIAYPYSSGMKIKSLLLRKISQSDRDEVVLVFKTDIVPESFNFLRRQKAEIINTNISGLKISKEALRYLNNEEGVYVLVGNIMKFKRCNVISELSDSYIVSIKDPMENSENDYGYLQMHDSVIVSGKNLFDGKLVG